MSSDARAPRPTPPAPPGRPRRGGPALPRRSRTALLAAAFAVLATPLLPARAAAQDTLRIVAWNIRHGRGTDGVVDLARIAAVLRALDADVVALQEVDDRTERTGGVDQVRELARLLGMRGFHGPHRAYRGGWYGNAVLTRLPVLEVRTHPVPPAAGSDLAVHEVRVAADRRGSPVSVVSVHLAGAPEERRAQADSVDALFREAEHPVVLAGDFNARRGDVVMRRFEEGWRALSKDGPGETFPADAPDREIDFVLLGGSAGFEILEHRVVAEALASDHRPIVVALRIW